MTRLFILGLAYIIVNPACRPRTSQIHFKRSDTLQSEGLNFDTSKIAIFNLSAEEWLSKRFDDTKPFNLTDADLKTIDAVFIKCLIENNIDTGHFHYKRQYVPFIDKAGHKKVWINCFCSDFNDDIAYWRKSIVLVSDGGSCFFNVIIDIMDNSFSNFSVNAVA
jgi:hypothetical protein